MPKPSAESGLHRRPTPVYLNPSASLRESRIESRAALLDASWTRDSFIALSREPCAWEHDLSAKDPASEVAERWWDTPVAQYPGVDPRLIGRHCPTLRPCSKDAHHDLAPAPYYNYTLLSTVISISFTITLHQDPQRDPHCVQLLRP